MIWLKLIDNRVPIINASGPVLLLLLKAKGSLPSAALEALA